MTETRSSGANPRALLLTGPPASGKTLLAGRLAARFGASCCAKDEIKEVLFDTLGAGDAAWSRRLSDASFALLFAYVPRLLRPGQLLLVEGNFRPGEHEQPLAAALRAGAAQLAQVLCAADPALRAARLAARAGDARRHHAHRVQPLALAARESGLLDLPGPQWIYYSGAPGEGEWCSLCERLERWLAAAPVTAHATAPGTAQANALSTAPAAAPTLPP